MLIVESPIAQFFDLTGDPLQAGSVYIGTANQNPETTPQTVYWDTALTQPAAQPIQTTNGYPSRNGTPAQLFCASNYSITIRNASGVMVFYSSNSTQFSLSSALAGTSGANLVGFNNTTVGAVLSTVYGQTAAEIAASITPTNWGYPQGYLERYGGGVSASASANDTALTNALAVVTAANGGTVWALAAGTYSFASSHSIAANAIRLIGGGKGATILNYTGSGTFLTQTSAAGRCEINGFQIKGTAQTGTGLALGDTSGNATLSRYKDLLFTGFNTGCRMGGGTWLTFEGCEFGNPASSMLGTITNNVGIDFNYWGGNNYSSALMFRDCDACNNGGAGVQATSVSVTMNSVTWQNCNVQNNCQNSTGTPQFYMGAVKGFSVDNLYIEYVLGGTKPNGIRTDNMSNGRIDGIYINGAATGIIDVGGGGMNYVEIDRHNIFNCSTAAINCASETDVIVRNGTVTSTVTLTGTGCSYLPTGSGLASWPTNESSFTPALTFAGGSITQTVAAATYSQVGNVVTVSFRINWSAISSPSGNVGISGLPVAPKSGGPDVALSVFVSGVTISSGYVVALLDNGSTSALLYGDATSTAQIQGSAFASSGSIVVSGSYQV